MTEASKIDITQAGISLNFNDAWHPCEVITACLFLGNDDNTSAYCMVASKVPQTYDEELEDWHHDVEYHIFDELMGKLSEDFISDVRVMLHKSKVERLILICSDEDLKHRIRKELGVRVLFEEERRRNNNSVILREWFARTKKNGEDAQLRIWGSCPEAIKANYPPARDCLVRLLDFYDKRSKSGVSAPRPLRTGAGYH